MIDCADGRKAHRSRSLWRRTAASRLRRLSLARSLAALVLAMTVGTIMVVATGTSVATTPRSTTSTNSQCVDDEGSPMSLFGSAITSLGESATYQDAFAGAYATDCDTHLTIAVVPTAADSTAFLAAVAADSTAGVSYSVVDGSNSWAALTGLTTQLSSLTWPQWKADGLDVQGFGPDASTDTVLVTLESPTSEDLVALGSTAGSIGIVTPPVTAATYQVLAAQVLVALYGNRVSVASIYGQPLSLFLNRFTDTTPYSGGDQVTYVANGLETWCTTGFAVRGNGSGDDFLLTAGHCGTTSGWYLSGRQSGYGDGTDMGGTSGSGNYFQDPAEDDFQTILTLPIGSNSAEGYIYYGTGDTKYYIEGPATVAKGQKMTFDGSVTGQVRGATAGNSGLCEWFDSHTVQVCHLIEGTDSATICQSGDSGGPVIVVDDNTGGATAVATIVGGSETDCYGETIGQEESASNTTLLVG